MNVGLLSQTVSYLFSAQFHLQLGLTYLLHQSINCIMTYIIWGMDKCPLHRSIYCSVNIWKMDKCPLCFNTYNKPKLLPCLDTVCFSCLDEHVLKDGRDSGSFPCPVCNIEIGLPDGGITKFDDNQFIKGKQMIVKVENSPRICEVWIFIQIVYLGYRCLSNVSICVIPCKSDEKIRTN